MLWCTVQTVRLHHCALPHVRGNHVNNSLQIMLGYNLYSGRGYTTSLPSNLQIKLLTKNKN